MKSVVNIKNKTVAGRLVDYAVSVFCKDSIPNSVLEVGKQALIDQYGLQIAGKEFPWSQAVCRSTIRHRSNGKSSVTGYGDKISPKDAAFVNSTFAHAQDFDDSHQSAQTHPGSVIIPACIAMGEDLSLSGKEVMKATIIGMEVMLRLAHSLCPACIEGGHHTPPTIGPFGAAIAVGLLLGLNKQQLLNALGICGSYSGALVQYTLTGGQVKRIHTALGAQAGVNAALLAKEGLTGPADIIEGEKGLWAVFGRGKAVPERLFDGINEESATINRYLLSTLMFKPYNCCYLIHPAIEAFLSICKKHNLSDRAIKEVNVGMSRFSISHAGKIIVPKDALGAQFSTSFTLAMALIRGAPGMRSYTDAALADPAVITLAKKIAVYQDAEVDKYFPDENGCIVKVTAHRGQQFSQRLRHPKGSPKNLMTATDVKEKFLANTVPVLDIDRAEMLYKQLGDIQSYGNISDLVACTFEGHNDVEMLRKY